eukprot:476461_1
MTQQINNKMDKPTVGNIQSNVVNDTPVQLKTYASRPLCCNGDCGSQFAKMIDNIIHPKNTDTEVAIEQIIHNAFWLPDSPLRITLIKQIENQPFLTDEKLKQMRTKLRDESCYIKGDKWTNDMISYFNTLRDKGYIHILEILANQTCLVPNRSLFEEISAYNNKKTQRFNEINSTLIDMLISNDNYDENKENKEVERNKLISERNRLKAEIKIEKSEQKTTDKKLNKELEQLQKYENRINNVKSSIRYQEMKQRNMALTDMEIYAVLIYCDENGYCSGMRESQREQNKYNISCEWKTFFYHLCCAVYKIREIFHVKNIQFKNEFLRRQPQNNKLYRGIRGFKTIEQHHGLFTISSFTHHIHIAQEFVGFDNGMIIALSDAFKQIYKGQLMAADVSWISEYPNEGEFLVAPISLNKHRKIDQNDDNFPNFGNNEWWNKNNVFEITEYKSEPLMDVKYKISKRIQDPMKLLEAMLPIRNQNISQYIVAAIFLGGLTSTSYSCQICHVRSRLCEYATSLLDGNIECPACRALFFQYPNLASKKMNLDELECYNLQCRSRENRKGTIKHTQLEQVEEKECIWGYKCRICGKQQRKALAERYSNQEYLDEVSERFINHVE